MLDRKTDAVLRLLIDSVGENYKVVNKNQLLSELPARLRMDISELSRILTFLKENDYVDVKYQDKEEICLATTVKAESYKENDKNIVQKANMPAKQIVLLIVGAFLAAFLGALAATLLGKLF